MTDQLTTDNNSNKSISLVSSKFSEYAKVKAEIELNETNEVKESAVRELRTRLESNVDPDLNKKQQEICFKVQEQFKSASVDVMVKFLRAKKFDVSKAYDVMKGYVNYRMKHPIVLEEIPEDEIRRRICEGTPGVLPDRDSEGRAVLFFKIGNWDPKELTFTQAASIIVRVLEKLLESPETQINGVCLIEDFKGYSLSQATSTGISEYKMLIDLLQGSFPCRFKAVHCINQPQVFTSIFNLIRPFLRVKLLNKIHVHSQDLTGFFDVYSKEKIPIELGGIGPSYDGESVAELLFPLKEE